MTDQPAPYSQEAEEATLGAVIVNPNAFLTIASFLTKDEFFFMRNGYIWEALTRLHDRKDSVDYVTLAKELQDMGHLEMIGGPAYLTQLINAAPSSQNAEVYGRLVERSAIRRKLIIAADEIKDLARNEEMTIETVTSEVENRLFTVTDKQVKREFVSMSEAVSEYFDRIEYLMENQNESFGVPSGFRDLDALFGGFQRSDLMIFAARPGMGKCVTGDTLIPTEYGLMPVRDLKPEGVEPIPDIDNEGVYYPLEIDVQTPDGIRKTAYFYDSGIKPTLKISTRTGYSVTGTHHHPVLVLNDAGEKVWKPLNELQCGDFVATLDTVSSPSPTYINQYSNTAETTMELSPDLIVTPTLIWDEITQIENDGEQHCYDLTVPDGHAFVTNGIVSHNTSFLITTAVNVARLGGRVAIFTMEMGVDQFVQRMISMETGISSQQLRLGKLSPREYSRFVEAAGRVSNFPIFIDDTPALNPMQMRTKCRRLMHEHGIDLVLVDYLQLMNSGGFYQNNRVQEVSFISRNLKELARELNVPMISAAQLSRAVEQRQDKRPVLSDLRESGCLAGESLVYLPDEGKYTPIKDLVGKKDFHVLSLNTETWKLEHDVVTNAFSTGKKPVYRLTTALGRTIRATANHKFLTICGWQRLDELSINERIAIPRQIEAVGEQQDVSAEVKSVQNQATAVINKINRDTSTQLAQSDVYWDKIVSIEPDGETEVYDLTVRKNSNFICQDIQVHNSLEQDADIVMFLYRDSVYNEASEFPNQADIIVAKHRNGPTDTISLYFDSKVTKFVDGVTRKVDLGEY